MWTPDQVTTWTPTASRPKTIRQVLSFPSSLHGVGNVIFSWHPFGLCVATTGINRSIFLIEPKNGKVIQEIIQEGAENPQPCAAIEWSPDGSHLATMVAEESIVIIYQFKWFQNIRGINSCDCIDKWKVDITARGLTFLKWSKYGKYLSIGTSKGSVAVHQISRRKSAWISRQKKKVVCGDWHGDSMLIYATEDRQIVLWQDESQCTRQIRIKMRPVGILFVSTEKSAVKIFALNLEGRALLLYNMEGNKNCLELAFQQRYGTISVYENFGVGRLMVGFTSGNCVLISTITVSEEPEEMFCDKIVRGAVTSLAYSESMNVGAICSAFEVKVIDLDTWQLKFYYDLRKMEIPRKVMNKETNIWELEGNVDFQRSTDTKQSTEGVHEEEEEERPVKKDDFILTGLKWGWGGRCLTVSTNAGSIINFLCRFNTQAELERAAKKKKKAAKTKEIDYAKGKEEVDELLNYLNEEDMSPVNMEDYINEDGTINIENVTKLAIAVTQKKLLEAFQEKPIKPRQGESEEDCRKRCLREVSRATEAKMKELTEVERREFLMETMQERLENLKRIKRLAKKRKDELLGTDEDDEEETKADGGDEESDESSETNSNSGTIKRVSSLTYKSLVALQRFILSPSSEEWQDAQSGVIRPFRGNHCCKCTVFFVLLLGFFVSMFFGRPFVDVLVLMYQPSDADFVTL
eukprot:g1364.t1